MRRSNKKLNQHTNILKNYLNILILSLVYFFMSVIIFYIADLVSVNIGTAPFIEVVNGNIPSISLMMAMIVVAFYGAFIAFYASIMNSIYKYYDKNRDYYVFGILYALGVIFIPKLMTYGGLLDNAQQYSFLRFLLLTIFTCLIMYMLVKPKDIVTYLKALVVWGVTKVIYLVVANIIILDHSLLNGPSFEFYPIGGIEYMYSVQAYNPDIVMFSIKIVIMSAIFSVVHTIFNNFLKVENDIENSIKHVRKGQENVQHESTMMNKSNNNSLNYMEDYSKMDNNFGMNQGQQGQWQQGMNQGQQGQWQQGMNQSQQGMNQGQQGESVATRNESRTTRTVATRNESRTVATRNESKSKKK